MNRVYYADAAFKRLKDLQKTMVREVGRAAAFLEDIRMLEVKFWVPQPAVRIPYHVWMNSGGVRRNADLVRNPISPPAGFDQGFATLCAVPNHSLWLNVAYLQNLDTQEQDVVLLRCYTNAEMNALNIKAELMKALPDLMDVDCWSEP